jgi:hypothetical protein
MCCSGKAFGMPAPGRSCAQVMSTPCRHDIGILSDEFLKDGRLMKERNLAVETAQVIEELFEMAKKFHAAETRGAMLGLNGAEMAFNDALATNEATVWETVRAWLREMVKTLLKRYKYPPDRHHSRTAVFAGEPITPECCPWEGVWASLATSMPRHECGFGELVTPRKRQLLHHFSHDATCR